MAIATFFTCLMMFGLHTKATLVSETAEECLDKTQELSSCESISNIKGYTYQIPQSILHLVDNRDCEHGWYQNGTLIIDSSPNSNKKKLDFVIDATPNLTTRTCEKTLQWHIHCVQTKINCVINYTVLELNSQAKRDSLPGNMTSTDKKDDKHNAGVPTWGIVLIVILIVIFIGIGIFVILSRSNGNIFSGNKPWNRIFKHKQTGML